MNLKEYYRERLSDLLSEENKEEKKKELARLHSLISDDSILDRLADIARRIEDKTITHEEGSSAYHEVATHVKDIKEKIKNFRGI